MPKLKSPINKLSGIGPKYTKLLNRLGVFTVQDFLYYFPFRYEDYSDIKQVSELTTLEKKTVKVEIETIKSFRTRGGKSITEAKVFDESGTIDVIWFNQPFLKNVLKVGTKVLLNGKLNPNRNKPQLYSPIYETLKSDKPIHLSGIAPVYPTTQGITNKWLRWKIKSVLTDYKQILKGLNEPLPQTITKRYDLGGLEKSIQDIHFPSDHNALQKARERFAFEELFTIQNKVLKLKQKRMKLKSHKILINKSLFNKFKKSLPFTPTKAQERSTEEILADLEKDTPMNRLLEGDVGSGKTVVAAYAALATVNNGFQVAILVPTSILAEQHFKEFIEFLEPFNINISKVTGTTNQSLNKAIKLSQIIIGTHALIYRNRELFKTLGLVIIDEQHRFGVEQRNQLIKNEFQQEYNKVTKVVPHKLSMTATPIPRSIALTIFGNLDISLINEMPEGRIPTKTYLVPAKKRKGAYKWLKEKIKEHNQAFWICPLIEESEKLSSRTKGKDIKAVTIEYEKLKKIYPDLSIEILHGKIKPEKKDEIMKRMQKGEIDILVSTSVVEVGMDIPNANLIIIESAERFGLAQLHQLRGRVGRREKESWCLLFTSTKKEIEKSESEDMQAYTKAMKRLQYFSKHTDGLKVAEYDLELRGPGEVYGTKQAGIPDLKVASFSDVALIKKTREAAEMVIGAW